MLRKWLYFLLVIAVLYAVSKAGTRRRPDKSSLRKRIDETITIVVWTLLAVYIAAFLYWLYTQVIRR